MIFNASKFFKDLAGRNKLCRQFNFGFAEVSGLQGFIDAISRADTRPNMVCVDDTSEGFASLENTPSRRSVKSVFLFMRHAPGDVAARAKCMEIMHAIFLQFLSAILPEKVRLAQGGLYLSERVPFAELDQYLATGAACCHFQITVDRFVDLTFKPDEWADSTAAD